MISMSLFSTNKKYSIVVEPPRAANMEHPSGFQSCGIWKQHANVNKSQSTACRRPVSSNFLLTLHGQKGLLLIEQSLQLF